MNNLTCICCGAPINRLTRKCEYCGTEYEIKNEVPSIRLETFQNPIKEYKACVLVRREDIVMYGEDYMKYTLSQLAHEMLPALMEGMQIHIEDDIRHDQKEIIGRIRIVVPKKG